jgi:hypothetical protein
MGVKQPRTFSQFSPTLPGNIQENPDNNRKVELKPR